MEQGRTSLACLGGEGLDQRGLADTGDAVDEGDERAGLAEQLPEDGGFDLAADQRSRLFFQQLVNRVAHRPSLLLVSITPRRCPGPGSPGWDHREPRSRAR